MRNIILALVALLVAGVFSVGCGIPKEVQQQLDQLQTENSQLKAEKTQWQAEKADLEKKIASLNTEVEVLKGKTLKDPAYAEAVAFIKEDNTNKEITRDHTLAAILIAENAGKRGIKCYWVVVRLPATEWSPGGYSHHFVGFNTTDKRWIYFCNSGICGDQEVKLEIGRSLYRLNGWPVPSFDDTIKSIHELPLYP